MLFGWRGIDNADFVAVYPISKELPSLLFRHHTYINIQFLGYFLFLYCTYFTKTQQIMVQTMYEIVKNTRKLLKKMLIILFKKGEMLQL